MQPHARPSPIFYRPAHRTMRGLAAVVAVAVCGACGTRMDRDSQSAVTSPPPSVAVAGGPVAGDTAEQVPVPQVAASSSATPSQVAGTPATARSPGPGGNAMAGKAANPGAPKSDRRNPAVSPAAPSPVAAAPKPGASPVPAPGEAPPVATGNRSVVNLASVGTYSGPVGSVLTPLLQGAQIWVKHINARGGLNGHAVKLAVFDDGGDPARHRAQVQEAVERQQAVAFLMNGEALTGGASASYITEKRVPVIGVDGGELWATSSPMYFPQQANADSWIAVMAPSFAKRVLAKGKKKLGTLVCAEASFCSSGEEDFTKQAASNGLEPVYRARASVAQPDFTAECLAARRAGVEFLWVGLDANSQGRLAASCARQDFRPIYAELPTTTIDRQKDDPNLDGLLAVSNVFPYFQSGTPATDEFQAAMRNYGKGIAPGVSVAMGWAAAKVLEKAGAQMPEPPTSASVLAGLWTFKDETLGGLTAPLNFVRDQPTKTPACWFDLHVEGKKWVSPDNSKLHCV